MRFRVSYKDEDTLSIFIYFSYKSQFDSQICQNIFYLFSIKIFLDFEMTT
jgi:hypothetical protein